jgi:hypothetical protein
MLLAFSLPCSAMSKAMWSVVVSWINKKVRVGYFHILIIPARESGAVWWLVLLTWQEGMCFEAECGQWEH